MSLLRYVLLAGLIFGAVGGHAAPSQAAKANEGLGTDTGASATNLGLSPSPAPQGKNETQEDKAAKPVATETGKKPVPSATNNGKPPAAKSDAAPPPAPKAVTISPGGTLAEGAADSEEAIARREVLMKTMPLGLPPTAAPPVDPDVARVRAWAEAEEKKLYARPPTLFDDDRRIPPQSYLDSLPLALDVAVSDKYVWAIDDVRALSKALGYEARDIPAHCQLRLDANLTSDKGFYNTRLFSGESAKLKFDGTLQSIAVAPWAVCDIPKGALPQRSGLIGRVGTDKYSVNLSRSTKCDLPQKAATALEITYTGNGKVTCLWTGAP